MKCKDCGATEYEPSSRWDICRGCMTLRGQLITAVESGKVCMDEFQQLQRVMARGRGKAASAIRRTLGANLECT